jgi:hypothetical protein
VVSWAGAGLVPTATGLLQSLQSECPVCCSNLVRQHVPTQPAGCCESWHQPTAHLAQPWAAMQGPLAATMSICMRLEGTKGCVCVMMGPINVLLCPDIGSSSRLQLLLMIRPG